jgi:hypothetical protein
MLALAFDPHDGIPNHRRMQVIHQANGHGNVSQGSVKDHRFVPQSQLFLAWASDLVVGGELPAYVANGPTAFGRSNHCRRWLRPLCLVIELPRIVDHAKLLSGDAKAGSGKPRIR